MKLLYMLKKQYSRFYLREIVVVAQVVLMVLLFTPILSKLDNLLSVDQLATNLHGSVFFFQADDYYYMSEFLDPEVYSAFFDEIRDCDVVQEVGQTARAGCTIDDEGVAVYFYNDALLKHLGLQIADYKAEDDAIPVLINQSLAQEYQIGDLITPYEGKISFIVSSEDRPAQFRVTGVLKSNNYYYRLVGGASFVTLESIGYKEEGPSIIALSSFDIVPVVDIAPSTLLFVAAENSDTLNQINASIGHLGHAESLSVMRKNSLDTILASNPLPFVTAALMTLLCLASVCSYAYVSVIRLRENFAMYYICGLSRKKALGIIMLAMLMLLIISLLISLICLPISVEDTQYNGLPFSISIVALLFVLAFAVVFTQYGSINPIKLMRKGD